MKATREGDRVIVELTLREAYKAFNHIEYATRPSMDWYADTGDGDLRALNRENQQEPFGRANRSFGQADARRLACLLAPLVDGLWLNEAGELEAMP